jgi:hypothetical protein
VGAVRLFRQRTIFHNDPWRGRHRKGILRKFVNFVNAIVTRLSSSRRANSKQAGYEKTNMEASMPAYEICYLDTEGALTYKFAADCADDGRAKVLAHAMKLPGAKRLEVWSGETLIYTRPSDAHPMREQMLRAS